MRSRETPCARADRSTAAARGKSAAAAICAPEKDTAKSTPQVTMTVGRKGDSPRAMESPTPVIIRERTMAAGRL